MRIGELSRQSGVSLPTLKYYLREGLLPHGTPTGRNQADYGPDHLRRIRLVRALLEVGRLSVAAARAVIEAVDTPDIVTHDLLGVAHAALPRVSRAGDGDLTPDAREQADLVIRRLKWLIHDAAPAIDDLAVVLATAKRLGIPELAAGLDVYADAALQVAERDFDVVDARAVDPRTGPRAAMVEALVLNTVLGEALLLALRRLAQEHVSASRDPDYVPEAEAERGVGRAIAGSNGRQGMTDPTGAERSRASASEPKAEDPPAKGRGKNRRSPTTGQVQRKRPNGATPAE